MTNFRIYNYLPVLKEISTEYSLECPVCGGKIKARKDNGAYLCVSNNCSVESIRKALNLKAKPLIEFKRLREPIIPPVVISKGSFVPLVEEHKKELFNTTKEGNITWYRYSPFFSIKRVETTQGKSFYPYYLVNDQWVESHKVSEECKKKNSSFYKEYLMPSKGIILMVEGEKCVDYAHQHLGLYATTPPAGFGWSQRWLSDRLKIWRPEQICILPDPDKVGQQKAFLVQKICWIIGIPCTIKLLPSFFSNGRDVADLNSSEITKLKDTLWKLF